MVFVQDADIGTEFFEALERVGSIHRSCRNLLSSHHHRAGLELMDAMSSYQEAAYERLCRQATQCNLTLHSCIPHPTHVHVILPDHPRSQHTCPIHMSTVSVSSKHMNTWHSQSKVSGGTHQAHGKLATSACFHLAPCKPQKLRCAGGCRQSALHWVIWMRLRSTLCCTRLLRLSGSGKCCSDTVLRKCPQLGIMPCSSGGLAPQAAILFACDAAATRRPAVAAVVDTDWQGLHADETVRVGASVTSCMYI